MAAMVATKNWMKRNIFEMVATFTEMIFLPSCCSDVDELDQLMMTVCLLGIFIRKSILDSCKSEKQWEHGSNTNGELEFYPE